MLPAAKALLVAVLVGGGTVGTYALAGGKFGSVGNGNAETTQTSTPEVTKPTVSEVVTSEDTALTSSSSSSTLVDGSAREDISNTSLGEGSSRAGSEDQGKAKDDNATDTNGKTIVDTQEKNETGDVSPKQPEGLQVSESLPAAPAERAQEATESRGTDDQALPATQPNPEDARAKATEENKGEKVNKEQVADAGGTSQNPSTNNGNTNTATKNQESGGGNEKGEVDEETRTASGKEGQPSTGPGTGTN